MNKVDQQTLFGSLENALKDTFGKLSEITNSESSNVQIEVPVYLDGKQIAKVTTPYTDGILGTRSGLLGRGMAI